MFYWLRKLTNFIQECKACPAYVGVGCQIFTTAFNRAKFSSFFPTAFLLVWINLSRLKIWVLLYIGAVSSFKKRHDPAASQTRSPLFPSPCLIDHLGFCRSDLGALMNTLSVCLQTNPKSTFKLEANLLKPTQKRSGMGWSEEEWMSRRNCSIISSCPAGEREKWGGGCHPSVVHLCLGFKYLTFPKGSISR